MDTAGEQVKPKEAEGKSVKELAKQARDRLDHLYIINGTVHDNMPAFQHLSYINAVVRSEKSIADYLAQTGRRVYLTSGLSFYVTMREQPRSGKPEPTITYLVQESRGKKGSEEQSLIYPIYSDYNVSGESEPIKKKDAAAIAFSNTIGNMLGQSRLREFEYLSGRDVIHSFQSVVRA